MLQQLFLIGNLGSDPEMRYTPSGVPVTNFSVATNRKWTNSDGTPGEETVWFRVSAWGRMAEVCNEYLSKGRQVFIEGRLKANEYGSPRIWNTQSGEPRASFEVTAQTVKFLGSRQDSTIVEGDFGEGELKAPATADEGEELPF